MNSLKSQDERISEISRTIPELYDDILTILEEYLDLFEKHLFECLLRDHGFINEYREYSSLINKVLDRSLVLCHDNQHDYLIYGLIFGNHSGENRVKLINFINSKPIASCAIRSIEVTIKMKISTGNDFDVLVIEIKRNRNDPLFTFSDVLLSFKKWWSFFEKYSQYKLESLVVSRSEAKIGIIAC